MATSVTLPKMGESVMEGTIIRWLKQEGEFVKEDEPLVEISTDKIDTELPSPASGVLTKIVAGPDVTVEVGAEIAIIDESASAGGAPPKETPKKKEAAPVEAAPADEPRGAGNGEQTTLSPLVRKLARERSVDLARVKGTGHGGRITKEDVLAAASGGDGGARAPERDAGARVQPPPAPRPPVQPASTFTVPAAESEDVPFSRVRKAIAQHMSLSRHTAADVTTVVEVDMTRVAALRARAQSSFERSEGFRLSFLPFVAAAAVQGLRAFPEFNAHVLEDGQTARIFRQVNLGIAVGRDEGLIVPVIHGSDGMNLIGVARAIHDLAERARTKGGLRPDDVSGATFTITNYGSFGGVIDTPIIPQPQIAILGTGAIVKRPSVISVDGNDAIAIRHMSFHSLSYDHRWVDGHKAAQLNSRIKEILEEADFERELGL